LNANSIILFLVVRNVGERILSALVQGLHSQHLRTRPTAVGYLIWMGPEGVSVFVYPDNPRLQYPVDILTGGRQKFN
jgi:hypothetical protein